MAIEGSLEEFSIADMFRLLASGQKTGVLHLERSGAEGKVYFKNGQVFFATSNSHRESLGKRLVHAGAITDRQLRQALGLQRIQKKDKATRRLGQILVDEGYLDAHVLEKHIQDQINDTLFDFFCWEEGRMTFEPGETCEDEDIGISVSAESIIMEASRRMKLWSRIRQKIPSDLAVFKMAATPGSKSTEIHLKPREWMLLCHLHEARSVRDLVVLTGYDEFEVSRALYGMYSAGLVDRLDDAPSA